MKDDTVSRAAAIDAVSRGCQEFRGIFAECEKNLNALPAVQTCDDAVSRQQAIDELEKAMCEDGFRSATGLIHKTTAYGIIRHLPSVQPEIIRCKDCKYRMPYDWMFSEIWRSQNIDDYSEDEIGCQYCDMTMKADDFCSRAERRTDE